MQTFNLDLSKKGVIPLLYVKQRDVGTKILINITDNGKEYAIPTNASFSVWFSGKSGEGNYTTINGASAFAISGNTVTVELIYQMLNNPGEHLMCLVMNGAGGSQLGLWNIPYYVEAIPGADSVAAQQYYQAFLDAQKRAEEAADRAEDAADRAESAGGGSGGGTIIVSLDEGNVATHTAAEIYDAMQNGQNVVFAQTPRLSENEFIPLKLSTPSMAVFSKAGYPTEFDIFDIEIDNSGTIFYNTHFSSALVNQAVEKVETDIAPLSYLPQTLTPEQQAQVRENIDISAYYSTTREVLEGANKNTVTSAYVFGLYDALMKEYPHNVQKREVHNDDGTFTNYEYVISTGEYNTSGKRGVLDTHIKKPKYLVLTGIHGREKNAIISAYRFIRDVLSGHYVLSAFREGAVIHIMPMGNPEGVDAMQRHNNNDVNINRNFDWEWVKENYSGASAASEKETQAIVNWLKANRDAELFIDWHNSGNINEVAMLAGLDNDTIDRAKKIAMRGIDRVIPHWRDVIGYTAHIALDANGNESLLDPIFSYSSFCDTPGLAIHYAMGALGIPSLALETTAFANGDYADYVGDNNMFTPETVSAGAEVIGNILLEFYEQYISDCECAEVDSFTEDDKTDIVNAVLVALMETPSNGFAYYSSMIAAVTDVNAGTIGTNADANVSTAVAGVYTYGGRPFVVLLKDTTEAARVQPITTMTINLNGHMLTVTADVIGIDIKSNDVVIDGRLSGSGVCVENTLANARAIQVAKGYSNAVINGGQYTATCPNGVASVIYVGQEGGSAAISNCEISGTTGAKAACGIDAHGPTTVDACAINMTSTTGEAYGVSVSMASNFTVYMDNCDISGTAAVEFVAMRMQGSAGEQNNALYVSNSSVSDGSSIAIGSDTHRLYIGKGNNFTADDTTLPSAVITTNEVYAQVG